MELPLGRFVKSSPRWKLRERTADSPDGNRLSAFCCPDESDRKQELLCNNNGHTGKKRDTIPSGQACTWKRRDPAAWQEVCEGWPCRKEATGSGRADRGAGRVPWKKREEPRKNPQGSALLSCFLVPLWHNFFRWAWKYTAASNRWLLPGSLRPGTESCRDSSKGGSL